MTETVMTAETAKTVKTAMVASLCCILKDKQKEGQVLSRTAKTIKIAKTVMKATSGMARARLADLNGPKWTFQAEMNQNRPFWSILVSRMLKSSSE